VPAGALTDRFNPHRSQFIAISRAFACAAMFSWGILWPIGMHLIRRRRILRPNPLTAALRAPAFS
jgi:hypothetical protein